jgi:hypothetical protein
MNYISFSLMLSRCMTTHEQQSNIDLYREWLTECAGKEGYKWNAIWTWRCPVGVYINDPEVASVFKLRFEL